MSKNNHTEKFELINHSLPFKPESLSPYLSPLAINIHYEYHHLKYVKNYNQSVISYPDLAFLSFPDVLNKLAYEIPTKVNRLHLFRNGAQAFNHDFFWKSLRLHTNKIKDFPISKTDFISAGMSHFGSGWIWIIMIDGIYDLCLTKNEESPLFLLDKNLYTVINKVHIPSNIDRQEESFVPLLCCDLWEHSFYPDYHHNKKTYLESMFESLFNWDLVRDPESVEYYEE